MTEFSPGTIVDDRFEVLTEVGQGGMGIVYRARHTKMDMDVALKVLKTGLSADEDKVNRFRREAHIVSLLHHPNIVQIYAIGVSGQGQPYIAMEFLTGRQMSDIIQQQGALPWRDAIPYMVQLCDAISYAHGKEIVHRDIKPSNIVITGENKVKLVDFGIAKTFTDAGPALTRTEMVLGSVFYLSPGQFQGRAANARSDIYSLGCTFFEMLAGEPPFRGDTIFDTVNKQANEPLPKVNDVNPKAGIPADLQKLLEYMTAKESENRPKSAAEVGDLLDSIAAGKDVSIANTIQVSRSAHKPGNAKLLILLVALLSGAALATFTLTEPTQRANTITESPLLTSDAEEAELVKRIRAKNLSTTSLAIRYSDLSNVYVRHDCVAAAIVVGTQAWYLAGANKTDQYAPAILMQLAHRYANLGYCDVACRIFERIVHDYGSHPRTVLEARVGYLRARAKSRDYVDAHKTFMQLEQSFETMSKEDVTAALGSEIDTCLRLGRFADVLRRTKQLRELYGDTAGDAFLDELALKDLIARVGLHERIPAEQIKQAASTVKRGIEYKRLVPELLIRSGFIEEGVASAQTCVSLFGKFKDLKEVKTSVKIDIGQSLLNDLTALVQLVPSERKSALIKASNEIQSEVAGYQRSLLAPEQCVVPVPLPDKDKIQFESPDWLKAE